MWRLYGFQRYHIGKGGYGFLNCFFFRVVECKHDYFTGKSHLLLCRLYIKMIFENSCTIKQIIVI